MVRVRISYRANWRNWLRHHRLLQTKHRTERRVVLGKLREVMAKQGYRPLPLPVTSVPNWRKKIARTLGLISREIA